VGAVDVVLHRLADVVEERRLLGDLLVETDLCRDHPGDRGGVLAVREHVVAIGVAIAQRAEQARELGMDVGEPDVLAGLLAFVLDLLSQLVAGP